MTPIPDDVVTVEAFERNVELRRLQSLAASHGMVMVPKEPNAEMGLAGYGAWFAFGEDVMMGPKELISIYRAMLAAAPFHKEGE